MKKKLHIIGIHIIILFDSGPKYHQFHLYSYNIVDNKDESAYHDSVSCLMELAVCDKFL